MTEVKAYLEEGSTRKDRLEAIAEIGASATPVEAATSWHLLMQAMIGMAQPEAPNTPKFNDLLLSIWKANLQARQAPVLSEEAADKITQLPQTSGRP